MNEPEKFVAIIHLLEHEIPRFDANSKTRERMKVDMNKNPVPNNENSASTQALKPSRIALHPGEKRPKRKRANGEGSIRKKSNGRWEAVLTTGHDQHGKQQRLYFSGKSHGEVSDKIGKAKADRNDGVLIAEANITVAAFMQRWLEQKREIRYNTRRSYSGVNRLYITPRIGRVTLSKLTPLKVEDLISSLLRDGFSPRVAAGTLRVLKMALKQATDWDLVPRNVAARVRPPKVERKEMRVWTPEQAKKFLKAAQAHRMYALYHCALATGLRKGELLGLHWADVDLEQRSLRVCQGLVLVENKRELHQPKTQASRRVIPLSEETVRVLEAHRERLKLERAAVGARWHESGIVFPSEVGTLMNPSNLSGMFKALLRKADVPDIRFHDLRHTSASFMFLKNVSAKAVSHRLGHTNTAFTQNTYIHLFDEQKQAAAINLTDVLEEDAGKAQADKAATGQAGSGKTKPGQGDSSTAATGKTRGDKGKPVLLSLAGPTASKTQSDLDSSESGEADASQDETAA
jgi:integrase